MTYRSKVPIAKPNTRWFTLIEIIVAVTILAVILVSAFAAYSNIIVINKRLELSRALQENSRELTEEVALAVREHGLDLDYYDGSDPAKHSDPAIGTNILSVRSGVRYYPMRETSAGMILCTDTDLENTTVRCFLGKEDTDGTRSEVTDSRVKIKKIRFFLSGSPKSETTNLTSEGKATIAFSLEVANKNGVSSELAKYTTMSIQTTISEKFYKQD